MSDLVWQKPGVHTDERIMRFLAGADVVLDRELLPYDIAASKAHVEALARIEVLRPEEAAALIAGLDVLADEFSAGRWALDARYEDGHSAIEAYLVGRLGDVGRKLHTGRSRNDQVLVASRLWLKAKLAELADVCRAIAETCLERAADKPLPLPGYTHLQRAVVSSTAMWFAGFAEGFLDNAWRARQTGAMVDANPLGTAAGYGVNLPLDRDYTRSRLGFARLQVSPVYAQLARGKYELAALEAMASALLDVRRLSWDLSLFTTAEFGFVGLPDEYTTGSSLMPNKRNPDVVELLRASYAPVAAARTEIEQLMSLPSGYHRDLQFSKGPLLRGFAHGLDALALLPDLLARMQWHAEAMHAAIDPSMYATDIAIEQAVAGVPFRLAYRSTAQAAPETFVGRSPEASLAARTSPGGAADPRLDVLQARLVRLNAEGQL